MGAVSDIPPGGLAVRVIEPFAAFEVRPLTIQRRGRLPVSMKMNPTGAGPGLRQRHGRPAVFRTESALAACDVHRMNPARQS